MEDEDDLVLRMRFGGPAAVFVSDERLAEGVTRLLTAIRSSSSSRPMIVLASNTRAEDLDPDLVTLVVRKPYDVRMITGILLSGLSELPPQRNEKPDSTSAC